MKWLNWSNKFSTWEPEENILDGRLIEQFHEVQDQNKDKHTKGRPPKAASKGKKSPSQPAKVTKVDDKVDKAKKKAAGNNDFDDMAFEKSVSGLEADLRRLPGAKPLNEVDRNVKVAPILQPQVALKTEIKEEEPSDSDDDEDEVEEEELVEWIPPDCTARVIVTDVTVDDFTVTLRESEKPEGFFGQSMT